MELNVQDWYMVYSLVDLPGRSLTNILQANGGGTRNTNPLLLCCPLRLNVTVRC